MRAWALSLGALIALPAAAFHYGGDLIYLACKWSASRQLAREEASGLPADAPQRAEGAPSMQDSRTHAEQVSDDFWAWFGPKLDEHERVQASMPERDDASSTILGDEMLDIEFEPVAQAPTKVLALEVSL